MQLNTRLTLIIPSFVLLFLSCFLAPVAAQNDLLSSVVSSEFEALRNQTISDRVNANTELSALEQDVIATGNNDLIRNYYTYLIYSKNIIKEDNTRLLVDKLRSHGIEQNDQLALNLADGFSAITMLRSGDYEKALEQAQRIEQLQKSQYSETTGLILSKIFGSYYTYTGEFDKALSYYKNQLNKLTGDNLQAIHFKATYMRFIGGLYLHAQNPDKAIIELEKALILAESINDHHNIVATLSNLGFAYADLKQLDESLKHYLAAQKLSEQHQLYSTATILNINLADHFYYSQQYVECIDHAQKAINLIDDQGEQILLPMAYTNLGLCTAQSGDFQTGIKQLEKAHDILKSTEKLALLEMLLGEMQALYFENGDTKNAFKYLKEFYQVRDAIFNTENTDKLSKVQEQLNAKAHEQEIARLNKEAELNQALLANQTLRVKITVSSVVLVLLVFGLIVFTHKRANRKNRSLDQINEQLSYQADRDHLTGLFNRRAFDAKMQLALYQQQESAIKTDETVAFILIDIDHFKVINDTYGHDGGDQIITEFAKRLVVCTREEDIVVRWGGEEFLIYLNKISEADLAPFIERLRRAINQFSFDYTGTQLDVTASLGVVSVAKTTCFASTNFWEKSIQYADAALYHSKAQGRNRATFIRDFERYVVQFDKLNDNELKQLIASKEISSTSFSS